jgi:hypothetical protein
MFTRRFFWIMYFIWLAANSLMFVLAHSNLLGEINKPLTEYWPFSVGVIKYYSIGELLVYTGLPLLFYVLYRVVQKHEPAPSAE